MKKKQSNEPEIYLDRQRLGVFGEEQAAISYREDGYMILAANFHSRFGEIDLIVLNQDALAFVEVRTRDANSVITPAETVTIHKQRRIAATARQFLRAYPDVADCNMRFDVVEVLYEGGYRCRLNRIENAFIPES